MKRLLFILLILLTGTAVTQTMPGMPLPGDSSAMAMDSTMAVQDTALRKVLRSDRALLKWKRMIIDSVARVYEDSLTVLQDSLESSAVRSGVDAMDAVYNRFREERYFRYLEMLSEQKQEKVLFGLFSRSNPEIEAFRVNELQEYLTLFPPSARHDQVLVMLGDVYKQQRLPVMALAAYLKQVMVFPQSNNFSETQSKIIKMMSEEVGLRSNKARVISYLNTGIIDEGYQANFYRYLQFLHELQLTEMSEWYFDQMQQYLAEFPRDAGNANIHLWTAEMYEWLGFFQKAAYTYQKLEILHPENPMIPAVYHQLAVIYRDQLREYRKAANTFASLTREFPSDSLAIPAQVAAAKIYAENMGQFQDAVDAYQTLIDNYPESPRALDAIFAQAKIYNEQMDKPAKAIERYIALTDTYPDFQEQSGTAFRNAADIYADVIKDYASAVDMYMKFAQRYPDHKSVPDRLAKAADIAEDELGDYLTAIDMLELVQKKYPDSDAAKTAQRRLPKLREKAQEPSEE